MYNLILGDCLEEMQNIPDKSIDMILCDLPYGRTKNRWDIIIPFDKLWGQFQAVYLGPNVSEADKSKVIEVCEKYSIPIFYGQTTQL